MKYATTGCAWASEITAICMTIVSANRRRKFQIAFASFDPEGLELFWPPPKIRLFGLTRLVRNQQRAATISLFNLFFGGVAKIRMANKSSPSNTGFVGKTATWPVFRSFASYRSAFLTRDLVAGLTLAAIVIPEQMATARLGGSLAFVVFGSNRFLSCGADSTITPIFAGGLALLAMLGSPDYAVLAAALAVMVGLLLVASGIFRLGWVADLLSIPVTTGFLAGISAHILISQLPAILGLPAPSGPMLGRLLALVLNLAHANPITLVIGLSVLAIIASSEKADARIPGALIGLIVASGAVVLMGLESRGVSVLGAISGGFPTRRSAGCCCSSR